MTNSKPASNAKKVDTKSFPILKKVMDDINKRYGNGTIAFAGSIAYPIRDRTKIATGTGTP